MCKVLRWCGAQAEVQHSVAFTFSTCWLEDLTELIYITVFKKYFKLKASTRLCTVETNLMRFKTTCYLLKLPAVFILVVETG